MRILNFFLGLFIITFFWGCEDPIINYEYEFETKIIQWNFRKEFEIKDIIKEIRYVTLEETPESIFAGIYKLIVKNERIYILDISPKALLVFDINGKFLHKVGRIGMGPGEFTNSMINFFVDDNSNVFLYDYAKRSMMKYDINGRYISSKSSSFSFNDFVYLPNNQFLLSLDIYEKKNLNRKVMLTEDINKRGVSFFHFNKNFKHDKLNMAIFQPFEDKIAYMRPVNDSLFIFDSNGSIIKAWFFDFGNRKLSEELKNDYERATDERARGNSIFMFNTPLCINNYIISEMIVNDQSLISVYDTINNRLSYEYLTANTFSMTNINSPLCTMADSIVVSYLDADSYYDIKESNINFSINPEVDEYLLNGGTVIILNTIK